MALTRNGRRTGRAAYEELRDMRERIAEARLRRIEEAKEGFFSALDELKDIDPNWETWFDDNGNIPPVVHWEDRDEVDGIISRIRRRIEDVSARCACFEYIGDNHSCPVHASIINR